MLEHIDSWIGKEFIELFQYLCLYTSNNHKSYRSDYGSEG